MTPRKTDLEKLTDENMKEYTAFSDAVHKYAYFLMKKRGQTPEFTIGLMVPMVRGAVLGVNSIKDNEKT